MLLLATYNIATCHCLLPDILKNFNPNVYGASTGYGDEKSSGANLDRAVSGAKSE